MLRPDLFGSLVRAVSRRAWITIGVVAVLAIGGAALALRLEPSTEIGTLVDDSSESFQATEQANEVFGDDAVIVLVDGPLESTLLTPTSAACAISRGASPATLPQPTRPFRRSAASLPRSGPPRSCTARRRSSTAPRSS